MWLSRRAYDDLRGSLIKSDARAEATLHHNAALQATLDWMTMRLTQLEHERAVLMKTYMGVTIPVPQIEQAREPSGVGHALNDAMAIFQDVGDQEATRLGLNWDDDGNLLPSH